MLSPRRSKQSNKDKTSKLFGLRLPRLRGPSVSFFPFKIRGFRITSPQVSFPRGSVKAPGRGLISLFLAFIGGLFRRR
jgi:hypothetical protein